MSSPDKPFVLRGGDDQQTAIHNRISAIDRIQFLTDGVDMRQKSVEYLKAFSLEMWVRWYKDEPIDKKIDEEWCQRAAEVVRGMEGKPIVIDEKELKKFDQAYEDSMKKGDGHADQQPKSNPSNDGEANKQEQDRMRENPAG